MMVIIILQWSPIQYHMDTWSKVNVTASEESQMFRMFDQREIIQGCKSNVTRIFTN